MVTRCSQQSTRNNFKMSAASSVTIDHAAVLNAFLLENPELVDYLVSPQGVERLIHRLLGDRPISDELDQTLNVAAHAIAAEFDDAVDAAMAEDRDDCADLEPPTTSAQPAAPARPAAPAQPAAPVCRFGASCTTFECPRGSHPPGRPEPSPPKPKTLCRNGPGCTKVGCTWYHPSKTPCRNGPSCTKVGCAWYHPSRDQVGV